LPTKSVRSTNLDGLIYVGSWHSPKKWRFIAKWRASDRLAADRLDRRQAWRIQGLRSGEVGLEVREMALWAFEKAPVSAIFPNFFAGFRRVFRRARPSRRKWAQIERLTATAQRGTFTAPTGRE
jgi:hypothetical protein